MQRIEELKERIAQSKALIFDFDGTLADSIGVWRWVDCQFLHNNGLPELEEYMIKLAELGYNKGADFVINQLGIRATPQEIMAQWDALALECYHSQVFFKPGVWDFLKQLRAQGGQKLAIATTCNQLLLSAALNANSCSGFFDTAVTSSDIPVDKNEPDIYLEVARRLGVDVADCIIFDDILPAIRTAKRLGATAVGMYEPKGPQDWAAICAEADFCLESFAQLL